MGVVVYRLQDMASKTFWTLCPLISHDFLEFLCFKCDNFGLIFGDVMRRIIELEDVIEKNSTKAMEITVYLLLLFH